MAAREIEAQAQQQDRSDEGTERKEVLLKTLPPEYCRTEDQISTFDVRKEKRGEERKKRGKTCSFKIHPSVHLLSREIRVVLACLEIGSEETEVSRSFPHPSRGRKESQTDREQSEQRMGGRKEGRWRKEQVFRECRIKLYRYSNIAAASEAAEDVCLPRHHRHGSHSQSGIRCTHTPTQKMGLPAFKPASLPRLPLPLPLPFRGLISKRGGRDKRRRRRKLARYLLSPVTPSPSSVVLLCSRERKESGRREEDNELLAPLRIVTQLTPRPFSLFDDENE